MRFKVAIMNYEDAVIAESDIIESDSLTEVLCRLVSGLTGDPLPVEARSIMIAYEDLEEG